jgi:hypothetical protein
VRRLVFLIVLLAVATAGGSQAGATPKKVKIGHKFYRLSQLHSDKYGRIPALHVTHGDRGRGRRFNPLNSLRLFSSGVGSAAGYPPTCATDHVLHAVLAVPNGSAQVKSAVDYMKDLSWVNYIYTKQTQGGRLRFLCSRGYPLVDIAHLPQPASYYSGSLAFANIVADLGGLGYNSTLEHYVVWYDANPQNGFCGQGQILNDSSKSVNNHNNLGPEYAVVYNPDFFLSCVPPPQPSPLPSQSAANGEVILHEIGHTLGAVQPDAPHATNSWHCTDDWDIMCYDDADATHNPFVRCPLWAGIDANGSTQQLEWFDCRAPGGQQGYGDDYMAWNCPAAPNYLATHWNIANSYQRNDGTVINGISRYTTTASFTPC